jgi:hypothetical protein
MLPGVGGSLFVFRGSLYFLRILLRWQGCLCLRKSFMDNNFVDSVSGLKIRLKVSSVEVC